MKKICPIGSTFVKSHNKTIGNKEHHRKAYCRKVKVRKYILNTDEINEIYQINKNQKLALPKAYTLKLAQFNSSELRNHSFKVARSDLFDPTVNVAVSVRWLYRKREIAKYYLKKEPSALQLAEEYKGIRNDKSLKANKQREAFKKLLKEYKNAK